MMKKQVRDIIGTVGIALVLHWCADTMMDIDPEIARAIRKLKHSIQNKERRRLT